MTDETRRQEQLGYEQAHRLGKKAVIERIELVDAEMDKPKANGFIETYARLFGGSGYEGLGLLTFYNKHCVPPVKMNPPMKSLRVKARPA